MTRIIRQSSVAYPEYNRMSGRIDAGRHAQQGSTLIEVLISMFILIFGVLVLMAAQLRSVTAVQEAENQTIVSLAAQNLVEGMLANPTLDKTGTDSNGNLKYTVKSYDAYKTAFDNSRNCTDYAISNNTDISKSDLASKQVCLFYSTLNKKLLNATVGTPSLTKSSSGAYMLTVTWTMQSSEGNTTDSYSYSVPIQD